MSSDSGATELMRTLEDSAARLGVLLTEDLSSAREYAAGRIPVLAAAASEPGFELVLRAERDALALQVGLSVVGVADAADAELLGLITGGLAVAARLA